MGSDTATNKQQQEVCPRWAVILAVEDPVLRTAGLGGFEGATYRPAGGLTLIALPAYSIAWLASLTSHHHRYIFLSTCPGPMTQKEKVNLPKGNLLGIAFNK